VAETLSSRVTRLEKAMAQMAESHVRLENAMAHLVEIQAAGQEEIRQMKQEALDRERKLDERIEKLVSAIGELISRMPPLPPKAS
jgi:predicted  nucleic acid-binding Zn-ribbon protein